MNTNKLKISIITPSFNSGEFIERAIKSVLEQDYKNFEHIIIDGGSTDNTVEILKRYPHLHWLSEKDNGQADAMNKGFEKSTGDIIVYLNADDYFFPGSFSTVIAEFKKGAKFVVGNVLVKSPRLKTEFLNTPRITFEGMLHHWEPNAFCHNPVGYFYLREVQKECPFNEENYASMDLEFLLDAAAKFPFVKVEKTLGCFEDCIKTKTGATQSKLDYWQPRTFPYIDKHLALLSAEQKINFLDDRRKGYAEMQKHMNKLNEKSFEPISAKDLPLISIIIPTYNCSSYLRRSIESVLAQGLENFQIIIVDDASTDDTQELLNKYYIENKNIRIIRHFKNKKLGAARNTGIDVANGKYIFFLDSDDWLEKGALIHLASIAEKYNAEIVACGVKKAWENGKTEPYHSFAFSCSGGYESLYYFADYYIGSIAWNKLYLKRLIEDNDLRFTVPYWHEDVIFSLKATFACKEYISIDNMYHNYFQRNNSILSSKPTLLHLESYINLYVEMIEFIKKNNIKDLQDGEEICRRLLKAHWSNDIFPKFLRYIETRSQKEWESECWKACYNVAGVYGYAIADFLISIMEEKKYRQITKNSNIFSPKKFITRCVSLILNSKLRKQLVRIYCVLTFKKIR
jgi:glycosyltransferase involved in cell wall biosynthesis